MLASGRGQSGRGIMCTVTSFVSCLFICTSSQLLEFSVFFVFKVFHHYLVLYIINIFYIGHILPLFSWQDGQLLRYCMSFATSLCQSDQ